MADRSKIEWTDASYTPIRAKHRATGKVGWHCSHATPGCVHCYAEGMNKRLGTGLPFKPGYAGEIELFLDEEMLLAPLRWKKPRMIFVCSMTDLFADFVPDEWIDRVFAVMALTPQHTYQVLTKRSARMREYLLEQATPGRIARALLDMLIAGSLPKGSFSDETWPVKSIGDVDQPDDVTLRSWPLPNVWLGVSAEDQRRADERIPDLLATPAAIRFVSAEPLLGPIDFVSTLGGTLWMGGQRGCDGAHQHGGRAGEVIHGVLHRRDPRLLHHHHDDRCRRGLDWIIVGGESGREARPMHPDWARQIRDQCAAAGTAFFFKQWGGWRPPETEREAYDTSKGRAGSPPAFIVGRDGNVHCYDNCHIIDGRVMLGVGKKRAGRLLDGVQHDAMPEVRR